MSQFNEYAKKLDSIAKEYFKEIQNAEEAFKSAERNYAANKRPAGAWKAGSEEVAKVSRAEADYLGEKAKVDKARKELPAQAGASIEALRSELNKVTTDALSADPTKIDRDVMALFDSGILSPAEYERLLNDADKAGNATMVRLIGKAAEKGASTASPDRFMQDFDSMVAIFEKCVRTPAMQSRWEELTAGAVENF